MKLSDRQTGQLLVQTVEQLTLADQLDIIAGTVASAVQKLLNSDGVTFVLREDDRCFYVDEKAVSPLWKGQRFPMTACISGWCMLHKRVVTVSDIYQDDRIPHDAYRPTFVKSLCMVPIVPEAPIGVIGTYWSKEYTPTPEEVKLVQIIANSAAIALHNLELKGSVLRRTRERDDFSRKVTDLELALYTMIHDLKNKIAINSGLAELVELYSKGTLNEKANSYLRQLVQREKQAVQDIQKLLALYRLTNTEVKFDMADCNLSEMVKSLSLSLSQQSSGANVAIQDGLTAMADESLVKILLENLLSNAFKYSQKSQKVEIEFGAIEKADHEKVFYIRDHGFGFDPSLAANLFKPFCRLHSSREFEGTGLGLASAAKVVEIHGGKIWAESQLGHGATFFFTLPKVADIRRIIPPKSH